MPCQCRVKDLDKEQKVTNEIGFGGNWVLPNSELNESQNKAGADAVDIDFEEEKSKEEVKALEKQFVSNDIKDMDEINDDDDDVFQNLAKPATHEFYKTRTYDISITYDFYFQTPRLWLIGYSEKGELLTKNQMYEDIMSDYADKTVTLEQHTHQGIQCMSIHPCKHSKLMKNVIDTIEANGGKPDVRQAIFFFLKFISSIIPTIEYDFTIDTELK